MEVFMIQHMVMFNLKHRENSLQEKIFFVQLQNLTLIPTVKTLNISRQFSQLNPYQYAVSMMFDSQKSYHNYLKNEQHEHFVKSYWLPEVAEFLEVDLMPFSIEN